MAVVPVRLVEFPDKFSFFQQGADNQVQAQDDANHEGYIGERTQAPEEGQATAVPGVADILQYPVTGKGQRCG